MRLKAWVVSESPSALTQPDLDSFTRVTPAIYQECPLGNEYRSISNGKAERQIVPFALIYNGLRRHVRPFDRKSTECHGFVVTRIKKPQVLKSEKPAPHELSDQDIQWTPIVGLDLVPHPRLARPEIIKMDYGMSDGSIRMRVRAAVASYMLLRWSVDCSPDRRLKEEQYRLWFSDPLALYGVKNAKLAPGHRPPASVLKK